MSTHPRHIGDHLFAGIFFLMVGGTFLFLLTIIVALATGYATISHPSPASGDNDYPMHALHRGTPYLHPEDPSYMGMTPSP